jgi:hypothetical protein
MSFKNHLEIYSVLIDGKKIRKTNWLNNAFIYLVDGSLSDEYSRIVCHDFNEPRKWALYEEPKKVKTVTLYRYTYQQEKGSIAQSNWISQSTFWLKDVCKLLKTESKTIEIEDV